MNYKVLVPPVQAVCQCTCELCAHVWCACDSQRTASRVSVQAPTTVCLRQHLSLAWNSSTDARLVASKWPGILLLPCPGAGITGVYDPAWLFTWALGV